MIYVIRNGKLVPKQEAQQKHMGVLPDIAEFQSPIDGSLITSRSQLREHERKFGVRQCGELKNATDYSMTLPYEPVIKPPER